MYFPSRSSELSQRASHSNHTLITLTSLVTASPYDITRTGTMPSSTDRKACKTRGASPMMKFLSKALATVAVVIAASSGNVPASHPLRGRPRRSNPRAGVGRGAPGMPRADRNPRRRWQDSMFWTYISSPTIANPEDYDGRYFQKRFRVPYPVFENIVEDTKASDWWKEN